MKRESDGGDSSHKAGHWNDAVGFSGTELSKGNKFEQLFGRPKQSAFHSVGPTN